MFTVLRPEDTIRLVSKVVHTLTWAGYHLIRARSFWFQFFVVKHKRSETWPSCKNTRLLFAPTITPPGLKTRLKGGGVVGILVFWIKFNLNIKEHSVERPKCRKIHSKHYRTTPNLFLYCVKNCPQTKTFERQDLVQRTRCSSRSVPTSLLFLFSLWAGGASGERLPSGDPLHGGGLHQRQAGHGGKPRPRHGLCLLRQVSPQQEDAPFSSQE